MCDSICKNQNTVLWIVKPLVSKVQGTDFSLNICTYGTLNFTNNFTTFHKFVVINITQH